MSESKIRAAVVAGQFYPSSRGEIIEIIENFLPKDMLKQDALACMLPHAGYIYSGRVAVEVVAGLNLKEKIILLGPNHTGNGAPLSIMMNGIWETPLGKVKIDSELAKEILSHCPYLKKDDSAHLGEHSLEVELPILQYFKQVFEIVPIAFMADDIEILKKTGIGIAQAIKKAGLEKKAMIVASSDMTHYESQAQAEKKDRLAIDAILALDEARLAKTVSEYGISMCGFAPAIVMLSAAKALGAKKAKLIKYQTSGEVTGERDSVVGYAGIAIYPDA